MLTQFPWRVRYCYLKSHVSFFLFLDLKLLMLGIDFIVVAPDVMLQQGVFH